MKKLTRTFALIMGFVMLFSVVACGGNTESESNADSKETDVISTEEKTDAPGTDAPEVNKESEANEEESSGEGKVLNIWGWNDEFQGLFNTYFKDVPDDVEVNSHSYLMMIMLIKMHLTKHC